MAAPQSSDDDACSVLVGVAGWSYRDWKGVVYPSGQKGKLPYLARYLDCIEINTSFYRPVPPGMAHKWVRDVSDLQDFTFTAKLHCSFTHDLDEDYPASSVNQVREGYRPLHEAGRLLGVLVQFPFYFRDGDEERERLRRIGQDFGDFPLVVEVRDSSWAEPEALDFLRGLDMNVACVDMPLARRSFREEAVTTGPLAYLRLHGRNYDSWFNSDADRDDRYDYLYGEEEMDSTLDRIESLRQEADRVAVIWNNHYRGQAVVNALECTHALTGQPIDVPPLLQESYPRLADISGTAHQGDLFD